VEAHASISIIFMVTETLFAVLLLVMLVLSYFCLHFQNPASGAMALILALILAGSMFTGLSYQSGILTTHDENCCTGTVVRGNVTYNNTDCCPSTETFIYSTYSNTILAIVLCLWSLYLAMQIVWFVKPKKESDD